MDAAIQTNPIKVRDHHTVSDRLKKLLEDDEHSEYVHTRDQTISSTRLVYETDFNSKGPEHINRLVKYTDIIDCRLADHPDFKSAEKLATYSFQVSFREYESAASKFGPELEQADLSVDVETLQEVRDKKISLAIEKSLTRHEISDMTVQMVYGNIYQSKAGTVLNHDYDGDIAVIIKPTGKLSFRCREENAVADKIAKELGGGGRPQAAGVNASEIDFKELGTTQSKHQKTYGETVREHVKETIEDIL
jgi:oligoribonuclease NrnB/cAMP/cGMP phosphodiesterase (DHH superfamily)